MVDTTNIAIIPARGGSKRVPRKNIRAFCGKPALAYTIEAAIESGLFQRVIVSTEDEEITSVALEYGAEVPFRRDELLANDQVHVSAVTVDALERLDPDGTAFTYVSQLLPNCPLRTADDLHDSYRQIRESGAGVQVSVTNYGWFNPWWAMTLTEEFRLNPLFPDAFKQRSQDLPEAYCANGAIWWAKTAVLRATRTFFIPERTGWVIPWQRAVDIDSADDWEMAELMYTLSRKRAADKHGLYTG